MKAPVTFISDWKLFSFVQERFNADEFVCVYCDQLIPVSQADPANGFVELQILGRHPDPDERNVWLVARNDCGLFWSAIAQLKYKSWVVKVALNGFVTKLKRGMQVTSLEKLILYNRYNDTLGYLYIKNHDTYGSAFISFARSPRADELLTVTGGQFTALANISILSNDNNLWNLKNLGKHPTEPQSWICVRGDSGVFWFAIAHLKYKIWATTVSAKALMSNLKIFLDLKLIEKSFAIAMLGTCAIASTLQNKPVLAFFGAFGCGLGYVRVKGRIREIITERDRAIRKVSLQAFFNSCGVTPTEAEIDACLNGTENQHAIGTPLIDDSVDSTGQ